MKSILITLSLVLALLGAVWAIHLSIRSREVNQKKLVLTTFTVLADMASEVAGDAVVVESITKPGAEIHHYEPTPQDLVRVRDADLILDNGMGLELWANKLYANVPDVPHVTLSTNVSPIAIGNGPYAGRPNPHAWMSPTIALVYVDNIRAALTELAPEHASTFATNAARYRKQIVAVDEALRTTLAPLPTSARTLVTCEGAFSYLTRDYDMKEIYLWPINADAQGTPQQVQRVIESVRQGRVKSVYCESTVGDKPMAQVVRETGASFGGLFYVDSLSPIDGPAPTYIKMLEYNAQLIIAGLGK